MATLEVIGEWAFIIGVVLAIVAGVVAAGAGIGTATAGAVALVLVVLGLIVGILNVTDKEIKTFLIAAIALIAVGTAQLNQIDSIIPLLGSVLQLIVVNIAVFVAPAALVVALKTVYSMARKPGQSALSQKV